MFKSEVVRARYLVQIQETRPGEVFRDELFLCISGNIRHMPARIEHRDVLMLYLTELSRREDERTVVSERRHGPGSEEAGEYGGGTF